MKVIFLFSIILLTLPLVHSQSVYQLNITAYQSFYAQHCSVGSSYPPSCAPFSNSSSSLWIPEGIPDENSTVIIDSFDSAIYFVIAQTITVNLTKLSLNGSVTLVVEGTLNCITRPIVNNTLVVCDDSVVSVSNSGVLISYKTAFYDQSSLLVNASKNCQLNTVLASGTDISFNFVGGFTLFGSVTGNVQRITASKGAYVSGSVLNAYNLSVAENASLAISITVLSKGELAGTAYSIKGLIGVSSSEISINGCANIAYVAASESSNVTLFTGAASCTLAAVSISDQARMTLIGNQNVIIKTLYQNMGIGARGVLSFVQTSGGSTTMITLPSSTSPGFLEFTGNFNVTVGDISKYGYAYYTLSGILVTGHVNLHVIGLELAHGFQFSPNLYIYLPTNATVRVRNATLDLDNTNLKWAPSSTVWVDYQGVAISEDFVLNEGRMIMLHNYFREPSLVVRSLTIEQGSALVAITTSVSMIGNIHVAGALIVDPGQGWANLTVNGTLTVADTGVVSLPQMLDFYWLDYSSASSFLKVNGEAQLAGKLNITLGGKFPVNYNAKNYSIPDIPVLEASHILNNFASFRGTLSSILDAYSEGQITLSRRIANDTVYLHLARPITKDYRLYYIIGGAGWGCLMLVILIIIIAVIVARRRRKTGYSKISDKAQH